MKLNETKSETTFYCSQAHALLKGSIKSIAIKWSWKSAHTHTRRLWTSHWLLRRNVCFWLLSQNPAPSRSRWCDSSHKNASYSTIISPELWNVHNITLCGGSRTNNICESWNISFWSLVGCSHPSIWKTIYNLWKDQNSVQVAILLDSRGQPLRKRVHRSTAQLQQKLHNLCTGVIDGRKSKEDTLMGLGHCIRWKWIKSDIWNLYIIFDWRMSACVLCMYCLM